MAKRCVVRPVARRNPSDKDILPQVVQEIEHFLVERLRALHRQMVKQARKAIQMRERAGMRAGTSDSL